MKKAAGSRQWAMEEGVKVKGKPEESGEAHGKLYPLCHSNEPQATKNLLLDSFEND
jgi:hypothetical protein